MVESVLRDAVRGLHANHLNAGVAVRRALVDPVSRDVASEADVSGWGRTGVRAAASAETAPASAAAVAAATASAAPRRRGCELLRLPRLAGVVDQGGDGGVGALGGGGCALVRGPGHGTRVRGGVRSLRGSRHAGERLRRGDVHLFLLRVRSSLAAHLVEAHDGDALDDHGCVLPDHRRVVRVLLVILRVRQHEIHAAIAPEPPTLRDLALQIADADEHAVEADGVIVLLALEFVMHRGRHRGRRLTSSVSRASPSAAVARGKVAISRRK